MPLRRLTAAEYQRALVDLFGSAVPDVAAVYPGGTGGLPYSTFGSAHIVGDAELRQLGDAAEQVALAVQPNLTQCNTGDFAACARARLETLAQKAFRRTPRTEEVDGLVSAATSALTDGFSRSEALAVAIAVLVQHPAFLYVIESRSSLDTWRLDDETVGARLALTIAGRLPDDVGRTAVASLSTARGRQTEATRLHTSTVGFKTFVFEWLGLQKLPTVHTPAVRAALVEELNRLVDDAWQSDDVFATLLGSSTVWADRTLEGFYGLSAQSSGVGDFRKRTAPWRVGVLTHPLAMAGTGHGDDSSVILRGKLMYLNVLCGALAAPPANALTVEGALPVSPTPRAKYEARSRNVNCQGCHLFLDPLGFGFEAYDGQGRFRTTAYGAPVDETGRFELDIEGLRGDFVGVRQFVDRVIAGEWGRRCFARQWARSAFGVMETERGQSALACSADRLGTALVNGRTGASMIEAWATDPSLADRAREGLTP